jgi:1,4-dihydroxy-6-naphthoate synthase
MLKTGDAVLNEEVDAGVIIHESRFTYREKGLKQIADLGRFWEQTTKLPVPLGGLVIRRDMPEEFLEKVNRLIRDSVSYALENPTESHPYVRDHAQELENRVIRQHINLYVNDFSVKLGDTGKSAIQQLLDQGTEKVRTDFVE